MFATKNNGGIEYYKAQIKPFTFKLEKAPMSIFPKCKTVQFNYTNMIFSECLNQRDVSANMSNTKNPKINLLHEHQ